MTYYVVKKGREPGIYHTWNECKEQVTGFSKPIFKKFESLDDAKEFYKSGNSKPIKFKSLDNFFKITKEPVSQKNTISNTHSFAQLENLDNIVVYTDGACRNNGKKNAKAGIGVYFSDNDPRNVSERLRGNQTNQNAELSAILKVVQILDKELKQFKKVTIYTDSDYSIKCIKNYCSFWERNGWKKRDGQPIKNIETIKNIYCLYRKYTIHFKHIRSHTGLTDRHSVGNDKADKLATGSLN